VAGAVHEVGPVAALSDDAAGDGVERLDTGPRELRVL